MFNEIKHVPFTNIMIITFLIGYYLGTDTKIWSVSSCLVFGSTISFSFVPYLDSTVYKRQMKKFGYTKIVFYTGHFMLHIVPCIIIVCHPPVVSIYECFLANIIQLTWAFVVQGSLYLDNVYVPMKKEHWIIAWKLTIAFHYTPYILSIMYLTN